MVIGSIAMVMVGLGILRYFSLMYDSQGFGLSLIGITFLNSYVFYLEKKAGVSNKLLWIKQSIIVVAFVILSYILYL